jgi:hypothetical protein
MTTSVHYRFTKAARGLAACALLALPAFGMAPSAARADEIPPAAAYGGNGDELATVCFAGKSVSVKDAASHPHDVATQWFDLQLLLARDTPGFTPPVASRALGYAGIALYQAILPGMTGYRSLVGQLQDMPDMPKPTPDLEYHWPTVANSALATISREIFADTPRDDKTFKAVDELYEKIAAPYRTELGTRLFRRSARYGRDVALAVYAWAMTDGGHEAHLHNFPADYKPPVGPGMWVPTSPNAYAAMQPYWGKKRPFILENGDGGCVAPPPPPYSEEPGSEFYKEAREVYDTVNDLTPEQRIIALFWADDPRRTATPPGHSISILSQILKKENASLAFAAETYARLGIGLADAFISCWKEKYIYNYVRPVTAILKMFDKNWTTVVTTPPFPEYSSGHSKQAGAAMTILADMFGENYAFTDRTHDHLGFSPRSYASFSEIAKETAMSRLYGGIHYRMSIERGLTAGRCIGDYMLKHLKLKEEAKAH